MDVFALNGKWELTVKDSKNELILYVLTQDVKFVKDLFNIYVEENTPYDVTMVSYSEDGVMYERGKIKRDTLSKL